ncbi:MAG TPA: TIGR02281 family clan AA aspartic protease [Gammaproteobacteria bacterium]|nr:TIGR02281 family clan AA aspartic protease [Gammaproteobacteria bacterium]
MTHSTKKLGMMFTAAGWILGFLLLVLVFGNILDQQYNPNQSIATVQGAGTQEIVLQRSRNGHYVFDGEINHHKVTFLVDTGATMTAIPAHLQQSLGLQAGPATSVSTANGVTTAYLTRLEHLALGDIELHDVKASIVQGMALDEVLLGMNVLKHFELVQRGNNLIIRQYQ